MLQGVADQFGGDRRESRGALGVHRGGVDVDADLGVPIQRVEFRHVPADVAEQIVEADGPAVVLQALV